MLHLAKKTHDEELVPLEDIMKEASKVGVPKYDDSINRLPLEVPLDEKDMQNFSFLKKLQSLHNSIGENLKRLRDEIESCKENNATILSHKYRITTKHYTFCEPEKKLIRNLGNENKIMVTRLQNSETSPFLDEKAKELFKSILKELSKVYNEIERARVKHG